MQSLKLNLLPESREIVHQRLKMLLNSDISRKIKYLGHHLCQINGPGQDFIRSLDLTDMWLDCDVFV